MVPTITLPYQRAPSDGVHCVDEQVLPEPCRSDEHRRHVRATGPSDSTTRLARRGSGCGGSTENQTGSQTVAERSASTNRRQRSVCRGSAWDLTLQTSSIPQTVIPHLRRPESLKKVDVSVVLLNWNSLPVVLDAAA